MSLLLPKFINNFRLVQKLKGHTDLMS